MLLLATADDPDRRDVSAPESLDPESLDPEMPALEPSNPEPSPDEDAPAPEPEIPPREPVPSTPSKPEIEPPDAPEIAPPTDPEPPPPEPPPPEPPEITPPEDPDGTVPSVSKTALPAPTESERPDRSASPDRTVPESVLAPEPPARSPLQRLVLALLIIAAAALIGYVLSRPSGREADADALVRSVEAAGRLQLRLETDTPSEARRYVRDEFGWRVGVPVFEAIPLRGVAIAQTAPAVEVPVFLYADDEGRNVAVFAYSYALLDQVPDRLRLTAADYDALDEGTPFVRRASGNEVVLWRDRDDIYVVVTDLPPDVLIDGFAMAR